MRFVGLRVTCTRFTVTTSLPATTLPSRTRNNRLSVLFHSCFIMHSKTLLNLHAIIITHPVHIPTPNMTWSVHIFVWIDIVWRNLWDLWARVRVYVCIIQHILTFFEITIDGRPLVFRPKGFQRQNPSSHIMNTYSGRNKIITTIGMSAKCFVFINLFTISSKIYSIHTASPRSKFKNIRTPHSI